MSARSVTFVLEVPDAWGDQSGFFFFKLGHPTTSFANPRPIGARFLESCGADSDDEGRGRADSLGWRLAKNARLPAGWRWRPGFFWALLFLHKAAAIELNLLRTCGDAGWAPTFLCLSI